MKVKDHALDWFVGLCVTAALYMLVRPSSTAPNVIQGLFNDLVSLTTISVGNPSYAGQTGTALGNLG